MDNDNYRHALQVALDSAASARGEASRKARTLADALKLLRWRIERIEKKLWGKTYEGRYPNLNLPESVSLEAVGVDRRSKVGRVNFETRHRSPRGVRGR